MTAKDHYEKGNEFYKVKEYQNALECFGKAIELDDKSPYPWYGKGKVYANINDYEQALYCLKKAIELDDKSPYPWYGMGNVYSDLNDYEQALFCYEKAIEIDDMHFSSWSRKGNVYYNLKNYEKALSCYEKSIEIDNTYAYSWNGKGNVNYNLKNYEQALSYFEKVTKLDDMYSSPWIGKGNVYYSLNDYEQAKKCYIRSNLLGTKLVTNSLLFFSKYPQAPLFYYDLLKKFIHPKNYNEWKNLINLTFRQCQHIVVYISFLELTQKNKQLKQWQWHQWLGIVYYYMGHPIKSYEYFKKVVAVQQDDLMSYYYLILSCRDFAEPEETYLKVALDIAEKIKPKKRRFNFFGEKSVLSDDELQQIYYAGQLWYLDQEQTEALSYFESIKTDFLPAAYMCLELKDGVSSKLIKEIVRVERKVLNTSESFLSGFTEQNLDLELEDFRIPFFKYARYFEIKTGIGLLEYEINDSDFKNFEPIFTDTLKAFWYTWKLSPQQYQQIFTEAEKEGYRRLTDEIMAKREKEMEKQRKKVTVNEDEKELKIKTGDSFKVWEVYEKLKTEMNPDILESLLGAALNEYKETLPQPELYRKLTSVFALRKNNPLKPKQKIFLDFYSVLQEYLYKKPSEILIAGKKGVLKSLIALGINQLTDDEKLSGQLVNIFVKSFIKDSLAQLMAQWLKTPNPKYKTYSEFKNNFREFIGAEKKRLGDNFEKRYPLYGFEEWLD